MSVKERALDRKFAVLVMEEIEVAETATITHTLYWFESEAASKDLSCAATQTAYSLCLPVETMLGVFSGAALELWIWRKWRQSQLVSPSDCTRMLGLST